MFIDSGVLIDAFRGKARIGALAREVIEDDAIECASSDMVRLEILPKPSYAGRHDEVDFYEAFFSRTSAWADVTPELVQSAHAIAVENGLSAADALHIAAALALGCDAIVTSEKPDKAIHRVRSIAVRSLR